LGECGVDILEMKIGEGGAVKVVEAAPYGFTISCNRVFISLSVVLFESHFKNNWSI
jgi:hypothetical protein